jgi:uncharacterized protein (DUF983 family)
MQTPSEKLPKPAIRPGAILRARCPSCLKGPVLEGVFAIRPKCLVCGYDFHPEPGFYLGAMAVGFLLTAILTVPPTVALKLLGVDIALLIAFPLIEFVFVGTFLIFYCRILWLHLEHRMTARLDGISGRK